MQAPSIRPGGHSPSTDGDVNLYINPEAQAQPWFQANRRVIFVNGMDNTPQDHVESATALSLLQGCPVVGVFNKSDGKWADLGQCVADKLRMMPVQAGGDRNSFEGWATATEAMYQLARRAAPMMQKTDFVASMIDGNAAALAVYGLLAGAGGLEPLRTPIYCHSQGNLITSNALTAVALAHGPARIAGMEVNSFGSPCRFWPPGLRRTNNAFTFDPITWLDLKADMTSSKVGFVAGHGFKLYMQKDAEFVVNRFRFGAFGTTMDMDEEGLAKFLVSLGPNPQRLRPIFERLRDMHQTDSDDVALAYVQAAPKPVLQALKRTDPGLITLLIGLLNSGWTAADEKRAIAVLEGL